MYCQEKDFFIAINSLFEYSVSLPITLRCVLQGNRPVGSGGGGGGLVPPIITGNVLQAFT